MARTRAMNFFMRILLSVVCRKVRKAMPRASRAFLETKLLGHGGLVGAVSARYAGTACAIAVEQVANDVPQPFHVYALLFFHLVAVL